MKLAHLAIAFPGHSFPNFRVLQPPLLRELGSTSNVRCSVADLEQRRKDIISIGLDLAVVPAFVPNDMISERALR